jgi:ubiquinone/menaquinone biosynthesis C-methylase UbiE
VDRFNSRFTAHNATAKQGNAVNLDQFGDDSKDIVVSLFLIQDLDKGDGIKALRELRRVAKPNADALIGLTVNRTHVEKVKMWRGKEVCIWNWNEFMEALSNEGFKVEEVEEVPGKHLNYPRLYVWARVKK